MALCLTHFTFDNSMLNSMREKSQTDCCHCHTAPQTYTTCDFTLIASLTEQDFQDPAEMVFFLFSLSCIALSRGDERED